MDLVLADLETHQHPLLVQLVSYIFKRDAQTNMSKSINKTVESKICERAEISAEPLLPVNDAATSLENPSGHFFQHGEENKL